MSNSIWHKYDIKDMPDENKLVVLVDKHDGFYNACFVDKTDWVNDWYNHIEKWCYLDDLIAQADKAERLQKVLPDVIEYLDGKRDYFVSIGEDTEQEDNLIDEIKELTKGK